MNPKQLGTSMFRESRNFCRRARSNDHVVGRKAFTSFGTTPASTDIDIRIPGWVHLWRVTVSLQESVPPVGPVSPIQFLLEIATVEEGSSAEVFIGTDVIAGDRGFVDVSILSHPAVIDLGGLICKDLHFGRLITRDEAGAPVNFWGSVSAEYSEYEGEYLG